MLFRTEQAYENLLTGNNIISFYLGAMLNNAGVVDPNTQLQIVSIPEVGKYKPGRLTLTRTFI